MVDYTDAYGSQNIGDYSGLSGVLGALGSVPLGLLNMLYAQPGIPGGPPTGGPVEAGFPATNQMPPLLGPSSPQQPPPSSQPSGPMPSSQIGPPLSLAPPNPGSMAQVPMTFANGANGGGGDYGGGQQPAITERDMGLLPGFAGNLQAFGSNLTSGGNPIAGIINAIGGLVTGQRTDPQGIGAQNTLAQYHQLVSSGVAPGKALAMVQNPALMQEYYGFKQLGSQKNAAGEETPVITSQGQVGAVPGSNFMSGGMDKLQEKAAAEKRGEAQAATQQALPNALIQAQQAVKLIDDISGDKNLPGVTGVVMGRNPGLTGDQTALIAKIDQLHGQAFLQAWQSLKGAGARITNTEAMKATDAIGRLQRTQGTEGFKTALSDLRGVITSVIQANQYLAHGGQGQNYQPPQQMNAAQFSQEELTAEARRRGLIH